jgi:hypothetical protein
MKAYVIELQEELRKCQQDAIAIQVDNERLRNMEEEWRHGAGELAAEIQRLRGLLREARDRLRGYPLNTYESHLIDHIDAALGTQADQPDGGGKCKCDDHEAKYCVNRISRTDPCQCGCHRGANATATP